MFSVCIGNGINQDHDDLTFIFFGLWFIIMLQYIGQQGKWNVSIIFWIFDLFHCFTKMFEFWNSERFETSYLLEDSWYWGCFRSVGQPFALLYQADEIYKKVKMLNFRYLFYQTWTLTDNIFSKRPICLLILK